MLITVGRADTLGVAWSWTHTTQISFNFVLILPFLAIS